MTGVRDYSLAIPISCTLDIKRLVRHLSLWRSSHAYACPKGRTFYVLQSKARPMLPFWINLINVNTACILDKPVETSIF